MNIEPAGYCSEDIEQLLKQIAQDGGHGMPIEDLRTLYSTASSISPKYLLEIGSCRGCSSLTLGTIAKASNGNLQCIEYRPQPQWYENIKKYKLEQHVEMIPHPSPWIDPARLNTPIDYLLIDGNHIYRWALVDYHYFSLFVRKGGKIAFHDCYTTNNEVIKVVLYILETDNSIEVSDWSYGGKGLIVLDKVIDQSQSWRYIWEKKKSLTQQP